MENFKSDAHDERQYNKAKSEQEALQGYEVGVRSERFFTDKDSIKKNRRHSACGYSDRKGRRHPPEERVRIQYCKWRQMPNEVTSIGVFVDLQQMPEKQHRQNA